MAEPEGPHVAADQNQSGRFQGECLLMQRCRFFGLTREFLCGTQSVLLHSGLCVLLFWSGVAAADEVVVPAENIQADAELSFERDVRPILKTWCFDCHGGQETESGLDLRLRRFVVRGGESGPAAIPGNAAESLILQRVSSAEMPPGEKKMPAAEQELLRRWLAAGAPTLRAEPQEIPDGPGITEEERQWWAFQPIRRPQTEALRDAPQVRTAIDAVLLRQLQQRGLSFSADADRRTLIRRAYLDLLGIPPTPEQIAEFEQDPAEDAWEQLVDRLLESPQYGERWGRHWLDAAGYADSEGATNADAERPWAWRYRDYVVRSFNADKPLTQFLQEQLAGDELAGERGEELTESQKELLTAVGFLTMAANPTDSGDNSEAARNQTIADTIRIVSSSLLGLSVGCAQCHDHRYDPISQHDYYALRAILDPVLDWKSWKTPAQSRVSLYTAEDRSKVAAVEARVAEVAAEKTLKQTEFIAAALEQELQKYEPELRGRLQAALDTAAAERSEEQKQLLAQNPAVNISPGVLYQYNQAAADKLKEYDAQIAEIRKEKPAEGFIRTLAEPPGHQPESRIFYRGEFAEPRGQVSPAALPVSWLFTEAPQIAERSDKLPTSGRRLAWADWLTSGRNPLPPRVLMNRFWMHHFGRAIVSTPGEFGRLGAEPENMELLDLLAAEFIDGGWTWKRMHRLIMHSTVYRQSSAARDDAAVIDPGNRLYWRKPLVRLDAEVVRDAMLAVGNQLDLAMGGPPVAVSADDTGQIVEAGNSGRRSIYIQARRSTPLAILATFDAPIMETNCTIRTSTTGAAQSLMLLNSSFAVRAAEKLAEAALQRAEQRFGSADDLELELPDQVLPVWEFGYGFMADAGEAQGGASEQVSVQFSPLQHWTGSSWQAGAELPDSEHGWVLVNQHGGHPGDAEHAAIRRFRTPADGTISISGTLSHSSANGDGVRGRIVAAGRLIGEWLAASGSTETTATELKLRQGDTIDLIVDCRGSVESDSFGWDVTVTLQPAAGDPRQWKTTESVRAPQLKAEQMSAAVSEAWRLTSGRLPNTEEKQLIREFIREQAVWRNAQEAAGPQLRQVLNSLCQMLLGSNEFLYVE